MTFSTTAKSTGILVVGWTFLVLAFSLASTSYAKDKDDLPEVSSDGLHLVKDSKVRVAYAKPGASLAKYRKLILLDCYVQFKEDWKHEYNLNEVGLSGRVSDADLEEMKTKMAAEFKKVFTKELDTEGGYEIVGITGPDVLILRPAIINLDPTAPALDSNSAFHRTIVRSAGQMTLFLEFYDSENKELLARVIDPRADQFGGEADKFHNRVAADRILRHWADLLRDYLDEVTK